MTIPKPSLQAWLPGLEEYRNGAQATLTGYAQRKAATTPKPASKVAARMAQPKPKKTTAQKQREAKEAKAKARAIKAARKLKDSCKQIDGHLVELHRMLIHHAPRRRKHGIPIELFNRIRDLAKRAGTEIGATNIPVNRASEFHTEEKKNLDELKKWARTKLAAWKWGDQHSKWSIETMLKEVDRWRQVVDMAEFRAQGIIDTGHHSWPKT